MRCWWSFKEEGGGFGVIRSELVKKEIRYNNSMNVNNISLKEALEEVLMNGAVGDTTDLRELISVLGYGDVEDFLEDNPGMLEGFVDFIIDHSSGFIERLFADDLRAELGDWVDERCSEL
jgi:hypothetical protein